uniref:Uncharacterized protein n=1 Tax=Plectus sambesii TaxID=2011161 RepID=A0A914W352_9BILA
MMVIGLLLIIAVFDKGQAAQTLPRFESGVTIFEGNDVTNAWVDVDKLLQSGQSGSKSLISQFRDTTINMKFGLISPLSPISPLNNITVSANGVCYVPGVNLTDGLPNEDFIAPLMGMYETTRPDSEIVYGTDGTKFVAEWRNMVLQQQNTPGSFNFQLVISSNGTVWFLYRTIPVNFNATTYTQSTQQKLVIAGTNVTVRNPLNGKIVQNMASNKPDVRAQMGVKLIWTPSGSYNLDDITSQAITTIPSRNNNITTQKKASLSQLSFCAVVLSFASLVYASSLGK